MGFKNSNYPLYIFISAFILKLFIFLAITSPIYFSKYPFFAEHLAHGRDIGERILDLSPFYLYFTVLIYKIYGPDWEAIKIIQIFLGSINCILIYFIGTRFFDRRVGILASCLLLAYGNLTLFELTLEPVTWVIFFNSLIILLLGKLSQEGVSSSKHRYLTFLLVGFLTGAGIITKPNLLLFLPLGVTWIWLTFCHKVAKRQVVSFILLFLTGATMTISPITIRNYIKFNDFIIVTADAGKVFYHGNGPWATVFHWADLPDKGLFEEHQPEPDYGHVLFRKEARRIKGSDLKPSQCSFFWLNRTLAYISRDLLSYGRLLLKKLLFFWHDYEIHYLASTYSYYKKIQSWPFLGYGLLSSLSILGLILSIGRWKKLALLYLIILVYLLTGLVFTPASRYRLPAVPSMVIFASYSLLWLVNQSRKKRKREVLLTILGLFFIFSLTRFTYKTEIVSLDKWQTATKIHYQMRGKLLFNRGLYQEAIREFEKAVTMEPDFAPAYDKLGVSHAILGHYDQAERYLRRFISLAPNVDRGYQNLAILYELKGDYEEAKRLFKKTLTMNPHNQKAKRHLKKIESLAP